LKENRGPARVVATSLLALGFSVCRPAGAQAEAAAPAEHVANRCPALASPVYEELDARIQLLMKSEGSARELPTIVCTERASWVDWEGRHHRILGRGAIQDEVLDIVAQHLHDDDTDARASIDGSDGEPPLERGAGVAPTPPPAVQPADPVASKPSEARGGGIAVGFETELPSDSIGAAMGPTFDFGTSLGPFVVGGHEAFRFAPGARQVVFMDFQGELGIGAPLDPARLLGAALRFGAEWMIVYPEGNAGQAAVAPSVDLALRIARSSRSMTLFGGIDARIRLSKLSLYATSPIVANDVGASLTLGIALVDWSRK
jgi:hypothetical protein